jgi:hypothetical protein
MSQPTPPPFDGQSPYSPPPAGQPAYGQEPYSSQPVGQPAYGQQPPTGAYPPQYAGYGYAQPAQSTNTLAIVSLVMSILGFFILPLIGSVVGIITGHIAKKQIDQTGEGGSGMAIAGLVVGYAGAAIMVLVFVFVFVGPLLFGAALVAS